MGFRDDMVSLIDGIRSEVITDDLELRVYLVQTRRRAWSGGEPGRGTATDTLVTLDPQPKVLPMAPQVVAQSGGKYEDGDRMVRRISAAASEASLTGGELAEGEEWCWLIDGAEYRVVGDIDKRFMEQRVLLRRIAD